MLVTTGLRFGGVRGVWGGLARVGSIGRVVFARVFLDPASGCHLVLFGRTGFPCAVVWVADQGEIVFVDPMMAIRTEQRAVVDVGRTSRRRLPRDDVVGMTLGVVGPALNAASVAGDQGQNLFFGEVPRRSTHPEWQTRRIGHQTDQVGATDHFVEHRRCQQASADR